MLSLNYVEFITTTCNNNVQQQRATTTTCNNNNVLSDKSGDRFCAVESLTQNIYARIYGLYLNAIMRILLCFSHGTFDIIDSFFEIISRILTACVHLKSYMHFPLPIWLTSQYIMLHDVFSLTNHGKGFRELRYMHGMKNKYGRCIEF